MILLATLTAAASMLAGHPVTVECATLPNLSGGFAYPSTIILTPDTCAGLSRYLAGARDYRAAWDVLTLAHESEHASLLPHWQDETVTECRAIRAFPRMVALLGRRFTPRFAFLAREAHDATRAYSPIYREAACS